MKVIKIKRKYSELLSVASLVIMFTSLFYAYYKEFTGENFFLSSFNNPENLIIPISTAILFLISIQLERNGHIKIIEDNNTLDIENKTRNFFIFIGVIIIISIPCFVLLLDFHLLKEYFDLKSVVLFIKIFYSIIIFNYIYETGFDDYYLKITEKASQINYLKFILKWKKSLIFLFRIVYSLLPAIVIFIPFHVLIIFAAFFFQEYGEASDKVNGIDFSLKFLIFNQFLVLTALYARDFFRSKRLEDLYKIKETNKGIIIFEKNSRAYVKAKLQTKIGYFSFQIIELSKSISLKINFDSDLLSLIEKLEKLYHESETYDRYYENDKYELLAEIKFKINTSREKSSELFKKETQILVDVFYGLEEIWEFTKNDYKNPKSEDSFWTLLDYYPRSY